MKSFSNKFRENLREDRQLNAVVSYKTDETISILTTQEDKKLLSENKDFIITEKGIIEYNKESVNSINLLFNANLFKTTCKSVQIDCNEKIPVKNWLSVKIGVYDVEDDNYEYLNFGKYIIVEEPTFQADTNSYLITAYDKMIESMIKYDDNPLDVTFPIKHKDLVIAICEKFEWDYILEDYPNCNKEIKKDFYKGQNLTYRDILDDLNGVCGGSFIFDTRNVFILKRPTETNQYVDDNDLKDINVDFKEKYGPVNSLTITTNKNVVLDNREDTQSIEENGKTEFNIDDNYILNYSTDEFIDNIFNEIKGLEYCLYDIDSTGLLILEPLDIFTFIHNGIDYKTIMLNDDIKLSQGLVETTYIEKPTETEKEYIKTDKEQNKLNKALISIDKANAEIVLKVDSNGRIAQVRLDGDAEEGTIIDIDADQVNLNAEDILNLIAGNEINLTSQKITINSDNFKVDSNGKITANEGKIAGYSIIDNTLKGTQVGMCGVTGEEYAFWAGNDTGNEAPFRVGHDGSLKSSKAEITGGSVHVTDNGSNSNSSVSVSYGNNHLDLYSNMIVMRDSTNFLSISKSQMSTPENYEMIVHGKIDTDKLRVGNDTFGTEVDHINYIKGFDFSDNQYVEVTRGDGVAYGITAWQSDKRLKKNIDDSKVCALDVIKKIKHREFDYKDGRHSNLGYVADELEEIDSNLIIEVGKDKIKQPLANEIIPLLSKAIQEQQKQIEELKEMISND